MSYAPVQIGERIVALDVLRGFALLGIALVNISFFGWPLDFVTAPVWTSPIDEVAHDFVELFATGKFYPLFSLLFGIGFGIQLDRMWRRDVSEGGWFLRRMIVLFLIGVGHIVILWFGDILTTYAIMGSFLLLFRYDEPAALVRAAVIAFLVPIGFVTLSWLFVAASSSVPDIERAVTEQADSDRREASVEMDRATVAYRSDSWRVAFEQRMHDFFRTFFLSLPVWPMIFSMFLVGFWIAKSGRLFALADQRPWLVRVFIVGAVVGLPANLVYVVMSKGADPHALTTATAAMLILHFIGGAALMFAYASGLVLLLDGPARHALLLLAPMGRMALTNYLLQSVIFAVIFYGYGLGWFGRIGAAGMLLIAVMTWLAQIPLSVWWLRDRRYGPAEWLWRRLSYGKQALG